MKFLRRNTLENSSKKSIESSTHSLATNSMLITDVPPPARCMTIRTLEESLNDKLTEKCYQVRSAYRMLRTNQSQENQKQKVHFSNVEIRYYPMIIGDNPSVSDGCPVTIDWEPIGISLASLDEFENVRRNTRRHYSDIIMDKSARYDILVSSGHDSTDIFKAQRSSKSMRNERMLNSFHSRVNSRQVEMEEKIQMLSRAFVNAVTNRKKKERRYLNSNLRLAQEQRRVMDELVKERDASAVTAS